MHPVLTKATALVFGFSMISLSCAQISWAASAENQLIVQFRERYREPQRDSIQAFVKMRRSMELKGLRGAGLELVRPAEGLVKLTFSSPEEATSARERLSRDEDVVSISPNFLYRPALHLKASQARRTEEITEASYLLAPFANIIERLSPKLPEVTLPPSSVKRGKDPLASKDWAWENINMPSASDSILLENLGSLTVAVIDTGVDYNHEDLSGAMWRSPSDPKEVGFDFAHDNAKPFDVVKFDIAGCIKDSKCQMGIDTEKFLVNPGHGTHCAGHVGAVANNSLGIRGMGSSAKTRLMGLKFFYDVGEEYAGQGDDAAAIKSIDYAIRNGAKVISASWGGSMSREQAESSELKKALVRAQQAGLIVVIAAGNDGVNQDEVENPSFPAAYDLDNLIVVAANDSSDALADFSNYGAKSVHIAAPGVKILSTTADGKYNDIVAKYEDENGKSQQMDWDGTSMATPIVAGAVALVWSKHPDENYHQIRDRILNTVRRVPGLAGKVSSGGILDVAAALN